MKASIDTYTLEQYLTEMCAVTTQALFDQGLSVQPANIPDANGAGWECWVTMVVPDDARELSMDTFSLRYFAPAAIGAVNLVRRKLPTAGSIRMMPAIPKEGVVIFCSKEDNHNGAAMAMGAAYRPAPYVPHSPNGVSEWVFGFRYCEGGE